MPDSEDHILSNDKGFNRLNRLFYQRSAAYKDIKTGKCEIICIQSRYFIAIYV